LKAALAASSSSLRGAVWPAAAVTAASSFDRAAIFSPSRAKLPESADASAGPAPAAQGAAFGPSSGFAAGFFGSLGPSVVIAMAYRIAPPE
jgi:hypothetical protein